MARQSIRVVARNTISLVGKVSQPALRVTAFATVRLNAEVK